MSEEILISRATLCGKTVDALIRGNRFAEISGSPIDAPSARVLDARGKVVYKEKMKRPKAFSLDME